MISKIDRKTIIDKYNSTVSIELNGGQMIKVRNLENYLANVHIFYLFVNYII